jgi:RNA polymerase sigma factor FliA
MSDPQPSGVSTLERYKFEAEILTDPLLGQWFLSLCSGDETPSPKIPDETLALMEQRGLIRKTEFGWSLRPDGRAYARQLGLIAGPTPAESGAARVRPAKDAPKNIRKIWREYRETKSERLRNLLMEHYLHLVRYNAEKIHVKLPDEVELSDLMSAGIFGLMDAIAAFDPDRGVNFETYCAPRIRGMILDELRSMDWVPRLVRSRAHKLENASRQLEAELGRIPTNEEIARRLRVSMNEFEKMVKDASAVGLVSLSRKWFETDSNKDVREIDAVEAKGVDPLRHAQAEDLKEFMTKGLSRAEKLILILYYFEEMTMAEIAKHLDLSESRVSRMHSTVLANLRASIAKRRGAGRAPD